MLHLQLRVEPVCNSPPREWIRESIQLRRQDYIRNHTAADQAEISIFLMLHWNLKNTACVETLLHLRVHLCLSVNTGIKMQLNDSVRLSVMISVSQAKINLTQRTNAHNRWRTPQNNMKHNDSHHFSTLCLYNLAHLSVCTKRNITLTDWSITGCQNPKLAPAKCE